MLLNFTVSGQGQPILLLHGMAGSLRYWDRLVPELSNSHQVITLDLLGFGHSPKPGSSTYDYTKHIDSIFETIKSIKLGEPIHLVGHSTGALLALHLAASHHELVKQLTLISIPIYANESEARQDITHGSKSRHLAYFGPTSHILCAIWCRLLRPISRYIAPLYLPSLPKEVAQDSLLHTWTAYSKTLRNIVMNQTVQADFDKVSIPTNMIYGNDESPLILSNFQSLKLGQNVYSHIIPGSHNIVIDNPSEVLKLINSK